MPVKSLFVARTVFTLKLFTPVNKLFLATFKQPVIIQLY